MTSTKKIPHATKPRKLGARHRLRVLPSATELRDSLVSECTKAWESLFGKKPLWDLSSALNASVPELETSTRAAFDRARHALRALLKAAPLGEVCGPCTAWVAEHRAMIETIANAPGDRKGAHWRQHSAERTSPTAVVVDVFGESRVNRLRRRPTPRELACIAILYGARAKGSTVTERIRSVETIIREDQRRQRRSRID